MRRAGHPFPVHGTGGRSALKSDGNVCYADEADIEQQLT